MEIFVATPGIRFMGSYVGDHKRVITPYQAIRNGSSLVVIGKGLGDGGPAAADRVLADIEKAFMPETG